MDCKTCGSFLIPAFIEHCGSIDRIAWTHPLNRLGKRKSKCRASNPTTYEGDKGNDNAARTNTVYQGN